MNSFNIIDGTHAEFTVDAMTYNTNIVTKVLYWLGGKYTISRSLKDQKELIILESNEDQDWCVIKSQLSQMFVDFKMRELIDQETHDIRKILYIKAFANLDDFEEYEE